MSTEVQLIAPCGMNCGLCMAYLRDKKKCPGCRGDDACKNPSCVRCVIKNCSTILQNPAGFCFECDKYPCQRLKNLDKRYRTKYKMSMLENLNFIKEKGLDIFVEKEKERWRCKQCGGVICVHRGYCSSCGKPPGLITIRPSGILIDDKRILLVKQDVSDKRQWSLPEGKLEQSESLEKCLIREFKEETGLEIKVGDLLYVTDRFTTGNHVLHMTFLVKRIGEKPLQKEWTHKDPYVSAGSKSLRQNKMVSFDELAGLGFGGKFVQLIKDNFPGRGAYKGDFHTFYGEER